MRDTEEALRARAAALAEELTSARQARRPAEWLEELLVSALLEVLRQERTRCSELAAERARMWKASAERAAKTWPREALAEARARRTEALAIADRLLGAEPDRGPDESARSG